MSETREKKNIGNGKTPHLSNVGMAGQAGEKVNSPDGACVSQESGATRIISWFKNWRRKGFWGKTVSRARKDTDWIGPQMNHQRSAVSNGNQITCSLLLLRVLLLEFNHYSMMQWPSLKRLKMRLFLSAPHYRAVVNRPVWITLVSSKMPISNLACYYYSTLSSIRLKEPEKEFSRMLFRSS